ncbi:MAG: hypothetical protein LUO89_14580 [Methanothrix sp.]|nr:hypothetical protein [Methanothrix sp.]
MLDILFFVLAALPMLSGLAFVLMAFKDRMRTSAAPVKAIGRTSSR